MKVDKYYQDMIDDILNGASDREQLEIILELVKGLKGWNDKGNDYLTNLYYYNLEQIEQKIKVVLEKEDCYSSYKKAKRDFTELQKILSLYIINNDIYRNKFGALRDFILNDKRFSMTNDLEENDMLDFWYEDILLTLHKVGNIGYELIGIEVYDRNGNHLRTFDNIESLNKEIEVLDSGENTY
jgi:hypothetical protein